MQQVPVYYINLGARPDRRAFIEDQLAVLGLTGERIEAVSRADLTPEQKQAYCNPRRRWSMTEAAIAAISVILRHGAD
jgi:hypothetical protein